MSVLGRFYKQPVEVLDYEFDFTDWLADRSDTISTQTVTASLMSGTGSPLTVSGVSRVGGVVRYFAAGGVDGSRHEVACTVVTAGGRTKQVEMQIFVKET